MSRIQRAPEKINQ
jgi:flagellar biosynthesis chaperone FliJ